MQEEGGIKEGEGAGGGGNVLQSGKEIEVK